jgi:hypothetical protein
MTRRRAILASATAMMLALPILPAHAQAPPPQRIRGTLRSLSGGVATVQPLQGEAVAVKLAPNWSVATLAPAHLEDIKPNDFIGVGASGPDSHLVAIQVVVFPEALRGTGEGHYPWASHPGNSMTNANVEGVATRADGRALTLRFKGRSLAITVPADATIYRLAAGNKALLVPGAQVQVVATAGSDGMLAASRVTVPIDGASLPN